MQKMHAIKPKAFECGQVSGFDTDGEQDDYKVPHWGTMNWTSTSNFTPKILNIVEVIIQVWNFLDKWQKFIQAWSNL